MTNDAITTEIKQAILKEIPTANLDTLRMSEVSSVNSVIESEDAENVVEVTLRLAFNHRTQVG